MIEKISREHIEIAKRELREEHEKALHKAKEELKKERPKGIYDLFFLLVKILMIVFGGVFVLSFVVYFGYNYVFYYFSSALSSAIMIGIGLGLIILFAWLFYKFVWKREKKK